jgi:succinate dehydrogenase / fumarate reductase, cytochrome b subunit
MDRSSLVPAFGAYEFPIRRLHSLLGLMPLGAYLIFHLATNASVVDGLSTYQARADQIHTLGETTVQVVGWTCILLPMLFHGLIGLAIIVCGKRNVRRYPYLENLRYTLVRLTGLAVFAFVAWHVFQMTGWIQNEWWKEHVTRPLGGARFDSQHVETAVATVLGSPWVTAAYIVGTLAAVYHLSAGMWTAGITWGIWTSARAQRWARVPCLAFGLGLAVIGMAILAGMYQVHFAAGHQVALGAGLVVVGLLLPPRRPRENET